MHRLFLIAIWVKAAVGLLQMLGGGVLLFVSHSRLIAIAVLLTQPELVEDPGDSTALFLRHSIEQFGPGTQTFASIYLMGHGLIKIVLVAGLLQRQMWSYPTALAVLGAFVIYQCYRYTETHSVWLLGFTALDIAFMLLIGREYRLKRRSGFAY